MDTETSREKLSRDSNTDHGCGVISGHKQALQTTLDPSRFPMFLCFEVSLSLMQNGCKSVSQHQPGGKVCSPKRKKFTKRLS